jgi:hypothetical protein
MHGFVIIALGAIAIATLPIAPAAGQNVERSRVVSAWASPSWGPSTSVNIHRGHDARSDFGRRAHHYDGAAYFPYREYQGDTLWGADRFNDWWHDRPDRAFPRWVGNNQNCQRRWWSGGDWRC